MRVVDTEIGHFVEIDPGKTEYAILSHNWVAPPEQEQTYKELETIQKRHMSSLKRPQYGTSPAPSISQHSSRPSSPILSATSPPSESLSETPSTSIWDDPELSPKIRDACRVARENGYRYIWIDSSCIDKPSSSELSEAINSMYLWYGRAKVCYAFLADVPAEEDHTAERSSFRRSRWFTRGWTLQELIAALDVVFLSQDWIRIGSKHSLADLVEDITGISWKALLHVESLDKFSVAQRFSWASWRRTTRIEDRAYSLLGIFGINMPTLYGEGRAALRRLQEAIMRRIPDQSLFAWESVYLGSEIPHDRATMTLSPPHSQTFRCDPESFYGNSFIAGTLRAFKHGRSIVAVSHAAVFTHLQLSYFAPADYNFGPHGIRTQIPVLPLSEYLPESATKCPDSIPLSQWDLTILGCEHKDFLGHLLGRVCYIPPSSSGVEFLHFGCVEITSYSIPQLPELFPLSPATIERYRPKIVLKTVYISHPGPDRAEATSQGIRDRPHESINLMLARETRDALRGQGYTADLQGPAQDHPTTHRLTLSNGEHTIFVEYQHTIKRYGDWLSIKAQAQISLGSESAGDVDQADPSEAVYWSDSTWGRWRASLGYESVTLNAAGRRTCTLTLGLDFAGMGYYWLSVELRDDTTAASREPLDGGECRLAGTGEDGNRRDAEGEVEGGHSDGERSRTGEDGPSHASVVDASYSAEDGAGGLEKESEALHSREARVEVDDEAGKNEEARDRRGREGAPWR